ncbi:MAG: hypothetical protein NDI69_16675 [Bacteriovoracaceae bacterium]|nr:hypothetical protein [Bacteriovoracaceae bacterium]
MTIPQCLDLSKCSSFLVLKVNNFQIVNGASAHIKVNGAPFNLKEEQLIDRTQGQTDIEIKVSASRSHSGKSGAINDTLVIGLSLILDAEIHPDVLNIDSLVSGRPATYLKVNKWAKAFEKGLIDSLRLDDSGIYIFRHIKYLDEISKFETLDVNQLSAIKILNSFILQEATIRYAPLIHKLINEKRKSILRLPTDEVTKILSESMQLDLASDKVRDLHEKMKRSLSHVDNRQLEEMKIYEEQFELVTQKKYLVVALYKNLNDKIMAIALELEKDIQQLEAELAQLQHLIQEENGEAVNYEIN